MTFDGSESLPIPEIPISHGYAAIIRFPGVDSSPEQLSGVEEIIISNADAVIFPKDGESIRCSRSGIIPEIWRLLEKKQRVELIALINEDTGILSITDGTSRNYYEIGSNLRDDGKVIGIKRAGAIYGFLWSRDKENIDREIVKFRNEILKKRSRYN